MESYQALDDCFDQEQHGPQAHDNSMRPFCQRILPPSSASAGPDLGASLLSASVDIDKLDAGTKAQGTTERVAPTGLLEQDESRPTNRRSKAEQIAERHPKRPKRLKKEEKEVVEEPGRLVLFMPFLHYETVARREMMDKSIKAVRRGGKLAGDHSRDIMLLEAYLNRERPLHVRRTLDQYFYSGIDTSDRDKDQVVSKYCHKHHLEGRMLMVDQLWLWVIRGDLVVTCFAERWEQPKADPLNVLNTVIEGINAEPFVTSVYQLAMLISSYCCNIFDRPRVDQAYQFLDMFENSTGRMINRQTQLLRSFYEVSELSTRWLQNRRQHQDHSGKVSSSPGEHDHVLDALLELGEESAMLNEINDIRDELNIIEGILSSQTTIMEDFESFVADELRDTGRKRAADDQLGQLRKRWREQKRRIETRRRDLERMDRRAEGAYTSLRSLLELKQMQSNALEAKFARDQAVSASKQGQAILVFTVVTIIFLPMSFVATLFTINIDVWGNPMTFPYVAKYIFGIGLGMSIPLIIMALTVTNITTTLRSFLITIKSSMIGGSTPEDAKRALDRAETSLSTFGARANNGLRTVNPLLRPSPQMNAVYGKIKEQSPDELLAQLKGKERVRISLEDDGYPDSWARRAVYRGRGGQSDDLERGRRIRSSFDRQP
ncbi:hypothetical protein GQ53DRAFT_713785 [Thozetella sp. PMI_491]|nr:hypothetical protein GQ53DRAFT_713785 [Thozetella sp. PMI_491]